MFIKERRIDGWLALGAAFVAVGCGGSGTSGPKTAPTPTAKTKAEVSSLLAAYGQSLACNSLTGYGPRLLTHRSVLFDSTLGLWYKVTVAPDGTFETMYTTQSAVTQAGSLAYTVVDAAQTLGGPISITQGPFAGLTGYYLQSLQAVGSNGSIDFTVPAVGTTDCQFEFQTNGSGGYYGTATTGVALANGYLQTQAIVNAADGSFKASSTDSGNCASTFSFTPTLSGTGSITGNLPGFPATVTWATGGVGTVTYADKSTQTFSAWQVN